MLVNIRFQVLFHSPPGVLFTFPSQYCSTIGHRVVFRLRGWSPFLPHGFHVSVRTPDTNCSLLCRVRDYHPLRYTFPGISASSTLAYVCPYPKLYRYSLVWPPPLSLAATHRISFDFFSSAYLDVSLRRVPLITLCVHVMIHSSSLWWFPNSEIRGSMLIYSSPQLIAVSHVLLRLPMPRHSPYALFRLNFLKNDSLILALSSQIIFSVVLF